MCTHDPSIHSTHFGLHIETFNQPSHIPTGEEFWRPGQPTNALRTFGDLDRASFKLTQSELQQQSPLQAGEIKLGTQ